MNYAAIDNEIESARLRLKFTTDQIADLKKQIGEGITDYRTMLSVGEDMKRHQERAQHQNEILTMLIFVRDGLKEDNR